jgi:hypothetical protein
MEKFSEENSKSARVFISCNVLIQVFITIYIGTYNFLSVDDVCMKLLRQKEITIIYFSVCKQTLSQSCVNTCGLNMSILTVLFISMVADEFRLL